MKKVIYRVDDRFIHGQVMEGWVNYYHIPNVVIINDNIATDSFQQLIYESVLPPQNKLHILSIEEYNNFNPSDYFTEGVVLYILGSISDLHRTKTNIVKNSYINIGCLAHKDCAIKITDTVCISEEEAELLSDMVKDIDIFVHKVPWETPISVSQFLEKVNR